MSGSNGSTDVRRLAAMYAWSASTTEAAPDASIAQAAMAASDGDQSFPHYPKQRVLHRDGYVQRGTFLDQAKPLVADLVALLQKNLPEGNLTPAEFQVLHSLERWLGRIVIEKSLNDADPPTP